MRKFLLLLKSFIPKALPKGRSEFDSWASEILEVAGAPDNDSTRFSLAVMILHAGESASYSAPWAYIKKIKKAMASEVAGSIMNELKEKQKAQFEAERLAHEESLKAAAAQEVPNVQSI